MDSDDVRKLISTLKNHNFHLENRITAARKLGKIAKEILDTFKEIARDPAYPLQLRDAVVEEHLQATKF
jgi:hypothetical protein